MLTDHGILLFASLLLGLFLLHRIRQIQKAWKAFEDLPAYLLPFSPACIISALTRHIPWISGGEDFGWRNVYERQVLSRV
jgi:hypothetical protein